MVAMAVFVILVNLPRPTIILVAQLHLVSLEGQESPAQLLAIHHCDKTLLSPFRVSHMDYSLQAY